VGLPCDGVKKIQVLGVIYDNFCGFRVCKSRKGLTFMVLGERIGGEFGFI
jgi:hypothetical protein